jgi:hypothetical protein
VAKDRIGDSMAKTITLKDPVTREPQYPVTTASNVYDENGNTIPSRLPTIEAREFIEKEYENSLNLFDTYAKSGSVSAGGITYTQNSDGTITLNGTSTSEKWVEIAYAFKEDTESRSVKLFSFEKGKTYTFGIVQVSGSYSGDINIIMQHTSSTNTGSIQIGNPKTFNDGDGIYRMWINAKSGVSCYNLKIGIMVVEGSQLPNTYYPYVHGAIVHQKDVEGVLLWQNGSPTSNFSYQYVSIPSLNNYYHIRIGYMPTTTDTNGLHYMDVYLRNRTQSMIYLSFGTNATNTWNRSIQFFPIENRIFVSDGYKVATTSNNSCIPVEIYGIK